MKDRGVTKLYILNDKEVYGKGIADQVEKSRRAGHQGARQRRHRHQGRELPRARLEDQERRSRRFFFGGITQNKGVQVFKDVNAANPDTKLFGPDGVADVAVQREGRSAIGEAAYITDPTLDPKEYPPAAQDFFKEFKAKYGKDPEPYAIYGYEAMSVALDAIKRAGDKGNDRRPSWIELFKTKGRESVLGTYDIDENGDTTLSDYGGNRIEGGKLVFDKVIKAQTS
jgi:branched-chain amino acid transport system substrate-binding protein